MSARSISIGGLRIVLSVVLPAHALQARPHRPAPGPPAAQQTPTGIGRAMTRRQFLATPVSELASIEPGGIIRVQPKPPGTSEATYRDHLASGPRMNVRVRPAATEGLPERLWGGSMARGCDPESARTIAEAALKRGEIVSVEWTDPPARTPLGTVEERPRTSDARRLQRRSEDTTAAHTGADTAAVLRARSDLDRLNAQIAAGHGDATTEGTR